MGFRDELAAAQARIAALEAALAAGQVDEATGLARLTEERDRILERVAELQHRADVQEAELADARRRAAESEGEVASLEGLLAEPAAGTPTLTEHNRGRPTTLEGTPAGAICPMCLLVQGDRVEMWIDSGQYLVMADRRLEGELMLDGVAVARASNTVICPRCAHLGAKRS